MHMVKLEEDGLLQQKTTAGSTPVSLEQLSDCGHRYPKTGLLNIGNRPSVVPTSAVDVKDGQLMGS